MYLPFIQKYEVVNVIISLNILRLWALQLQEVNNMAKKMIGLQRKFSCRHNVTVEEIVQNIYYD